MNRIPQTLVMISCLIALPFAALAEPVTLTSRDGQTTINGTLLAFDDDVIVLGTSIGELRVSRAVVICDGAACPEPMIDFDLAITSNGPEMTKLAKDLAAAFAATQNLEGVSASATGGVDAVLELRNTAEARTEGRVNITAQPASVGFEQLRGGAADIFLSKTSVSVEIADQAIAAGEIDPRDQSRERVVALDALVPIVHPDNPVQSISLEDLSQIAAGRIVNWSEIGGNDAPIRMLLPAEGTAVAATFADLVLEPNRVRLRRTSERSENEAAGAQAVENDVNALTITSRSGSAAARVLPIRQSCGPLSYADDFSVKAEEYPLTRRIYAYTPSREAAPFKANFLEYMSSPAAQTLIEDWGYIGQSIETQPISAQGARMTSAILSSGPEASLDRVKAFAQELASADRLSTTFRFTSASSELDTKSQSDLERVATFLSSPQMRNREILVIGFSDDVGRFDLNERLALQRAASVRDALVGAPGAADLAGRITTSAYGPIAPVGCNDTANGRKNNRRVEIWLR